MTASHKGLDAVVQVLLENGADPNVLNRVGATALHLAALQEQVKCVDLLLTHGADVKIRVSSGPLEGRRPRDMTEDPDTLQVFSQHKRTFLSMLSPRSKEKEDTETEARVI
jgi:ankyrin repeat protein